MRAAGEGRPTGKTGSWGQQKSRGLPRGRISAVGGLGATHLYIDTTI